MNKPRRECADCTGGRRQLQHACQTRPRQREPSRKGRDVTCDFTFDWRNGNNYVRESL